MDNAATLSTQPLLNANQLSELLAEQQLAPVEQFPQDPRILYVSPPTIEQRSRIRFILGEHIQFQHSTQREVEQLSRHWRSELAPELEDNEAEQNSSANEQELRDLASEAPVIRTVNHLLVRAADLRASDIHFEPEESGLVVRVRIDGVMTPIETLPGSVQAAVISRLKLMARLDIGEKRLPQDGRIHYQLSSRELDLRISTLPGVHGESVVLRILDRSDISVALGQLGLPDELLSRYRGIIAQPHGMVLVTGPTGSGKTTTLYATLEKINSSERKIITVEDPVEYQLAGVTQIHVNTKVGLDFSSGLRSIVRQDPDVIMVGEIRDQETAEIAVESALTGHLVFSTLHTNDAAGAVTRLEDMGIEPYLLSSSLMAVLAQRLTRKVCPHCQEENELTAEERTILEIDHEESFTVARGKGCDRCGMTGYHGRVGLYELLIISDRVKHLITQGGDAREIRNQAISEGMRTLREDGLQKLRRHLTTPEEVLRVTRLH